MEQIASSSSGLTLSELSRATGLAPATCHRLLSALSKSGLVERDEATKTWRPGVALVRIAAAVVPNDGVGPLVDRALTALRDRWQEFFYLGVLSDGHVVCVRSIQTSEPHRVLLSLPVGRRVVMHAAASSRAILSQLPNAEVRRLVAAELREQFTPRTHISVASLLKDLEVTRKRGYALCEEEIEFGITEYAVAVAGGPGEASRSLTVVGPSQRLQRLADEGMIDDLRRHGQHLSDAMGAALPSAADGTNGSDRLRSPSRRTTP